MLTQDEYSLFTGQCANYSDTDWGVMVDVAKARLASLLCLEQFPELTESNKDLAMLLANFLCAAIKFQGSPDNVESKSVRNFTINFKVSATNAFEQIYSQYRDVIDKYSHCGSEIKVERSSWSCCGRYNNGFLNF